MQAEIDQTRTMERGIRHEVASTMLGIEAKSANKYIDRMDQATQALENYQQDKRTLQYSQVRCDECSYHRWT